MKVNEWSGSGNHNTALLWEYDTRTAGRLNRDPKPNPSISDYSVFDSNPVLEHDLLGNTPNKYEVDGKTGAATKVDNTGGDVIDYVHVKTPAITTLFGILPASESWITTPVTKTINYRVGLNYYRGPGEILIGTAYS